MFTDLYIKLSTSVSPVDENLHHDSTVLPNTNISTISDFANIVYTVFNTIA